MSGELSELAIALGSMAVTLSSPFTAFCDFFAAAEIRPAKNATAIKSVRYALTRAIDAYC